MNMNAAPSWIQGVLSALLVALVGLVLSLPTTAHAQQQQPGSQSASQEAVARGPRCPPDVARRIQEASAGIQDDLRFTYKPLADAWMTDQGGLLDSLSICVGNFDWRAAFRLRLPTLDGIIEALIQAAIRRVCRAARDAVRNVDSIFGGAGYYMNSPIPGMGRLGGEIGVGVGSTGQAPTAPGEMSNMRTGVNGNPASFYVHVPTAEEWQRILPPATAPAVPFVPAAQENQP